MNKGYQDILQYRTTGRGTREITAEVAKVVRESGVHIGLVNVYVQHTSCALTITENADPDVRRDLETIMERLVPDGDHYNHDFEGPDDMASHGRSVLTNTALTLPVGGGRVMLGTWQGIFLWEHRVDPQHRAVVVTVLGT